MAREAETSDVHPEPDENLLVRLRERIKELTILHETARILQDEESSESVLIDRIVRALPAAWQFPDVTVARIVVGESVFASAGFRETEWRQSAPFSTQSGSRGRIDIFYTERKPDSFEGPFLTEERHLIDTLAEMLRAYVQRKQDSRALEAANEMLETQVARRTSELLAANRALEAEIEENRRSRAEIAQQHDQLRLLARELSLTEDRERRVIAADLHDRIGQTLVFIKSKIMSLQGDAIFSGFDKNLSAILNLLDRTIGATRSLTSEISPPVLYELGLTPALQWLADRFRGESGLEVVVRDARGVGDIPVDLRAMLFKCVRELLVNVFKHARATRVEVTLRRRDGEIAIEVEDDGEGFDASELDFAAVESQGFGLFSIRTRLELLGGRMALASKPARGTTVTLIARVQERQEPDEPQDRDR